MNALEVTANSGSLGRGKPVRPRNAVHELLRGAGTPIRPISPVGGQRTESAWA